MKLLNERTPAELQGLDPDLVAACAEMERMAIKRGVHFVDDDEQVRKEILSPVDEETTSGADIPPARPRGELWTDNI